MENRALEYGDERGGVQIPAPHPAHSYCCDGSCTSTWCGAVRSWKVMWGCGRVARHTRESRVLSSELRTSWCPGSQVRHYLSRLVGPSHKAAAHQSHVSDCCLPQVGAGDGCGANEHSPRALIEVGVQLPACAVAGWLAGWGRSELFDAVGAGWLGLCDQALMLRPRHSHGCPRGPPLSE